MTQAIEIGNGAIAMSPHDEFVAQIDYTVDRAQRALLALQKPEGYWHGPLEANAEMNAEFIIFNHFMDTVEVETEARLKKHLLDIQSPDGSWALFQGGEGYLSTTIESYFALKLTGMRAGDEPMAAARRWILSKGGIVNCGTLARFYLASMGQITWDATAALPIELSLFPNWFPFNIYELGSWARGTLMGLMMLQAARPEKKIDYQRGVLELFIEPPHFTKFKQPRGKTLLSMRNALNVADKALRFYDRHKIKSLRARALRHTEQWLLEHQEANGSWGGIEPCYLLSAMALKANGYRNDHPVLKRAIEASNELIWHFDDYDMCMPCVSVNWDTALAGRALLDSGLPGDDEALKKTSQWLIDHQIFKKGDWSIKRPELEPGGWAFEFYNDCYPDVDDSAVILSVLADSNGSRPGGEGARDSRWRELGDGNAIEGRRLRGVRRRQQFDLAQSSAAGRRRSGDRSFVSGSDRPRARDDGVSRLSRRPSGGEARDRMAQEESVAGGRMVGPLGRQLYLRNFLGVVGLARDRCRSQRAVDQARGRVAQVKTESRRWLG